MSAVSAVRSEYADDPDYAELLQEFAADIPDRVTELWHAFDSGAVEELRTLAHRLKGAGGGYGYPELTTLARELEHACKSDPVQIAPRLEALVEHLERIHA
jgi:HPt (histidine-containing phosphotransfer) domain-containing protein